MINTLSSYNGNSTMKVQVQGNTFASAMMSTLDVLDEYVLVDIEANNTWNEKSYLVDAHYFIDTGETSVKWYSTYSGADDEEGTLALSGYFLEILNMVLKPREKL